MVEIISMQQSGGCNIRFKKQLWLLFEAKVLTIIPMLCRNCYGRWCQILVVLVCSPNPPYTHPGNTQELSHLVLQHRKCTPFEQAYPLRVSWSPALLHTQQSRETKGSAALCRNTCNHKKNFTYISNHINIYHNALVLHKESLHMICKLKRTSTAQSLQAHITHICRWLLCATLLIQRPLVIVFEALKCNRAFTCIVRWI